MKQLRASMLPGRGVRIVRSGTPAAQAELRKLAEEAEANQRRLKREFYQREARRRAA